MTFSFGALVEDIKKNLSAQAMDGNGRRSRADRSARLSAQPQAAQLPRSSLSSAGKGPFIQRVSPRRQAMSDGESQWQKHPFILSTLDSCRKITVLT